MKRHTPTITHNAAACSCREWPGLTRRDDETIGHFTIRANEAHLSHVRASNELPVDLFTIELSAEAFGLFASEGN